MLIFHLYIFFREVSGKVFGLPLKLGCFLLLNFKSTLYILNNNSLSDVSFGTYFLLVYVLSFNSLDVVFHRAVVFNCILIVKKSSLSVIYFKDHDFVMTPAARHPSSLCSCSYSLL